MCTTWGHGVVGLLLSWPLSAGLRAPGTAPKFSPVELLSCSDWFCWPGGDAASPLEGAVKRLMGGMLNDKPREAARLCPSLLGELFGVALASVVTMVG